MDQPSLKDSRMSTDESQFSPLGQASERARRQHCGPAKGRASFLQAACAALCLWFLWAMPMLAALQSDQQAATAVRGWLRGCPQPLESPLSSIVTSVSTFRDARGRPLYHVVRLDPEGFVITSADSMLEPIVAFSDSGSYEEVAQNPLFGLVSLDLTARLTALAQARKAKRGTTTSAERKWGLLAGWAAGGMVEPKGNGLATIDDVRVAPLIQSRWNQETIWNGNEWVACYNYYTPPYAAGSPTNYPCGCVPTAWAQVMRYFQYPTQPVGTASFDISLYGWATNRSLRGGDGLGGPYRWSQMPLAPGVGTTVAECQAIGALTADIGVAGEGDYQAQGSATASTGAWLRSVFGYGNLIESCGTARGFSDKIDVNLDAGLPVIVSIADFGLSEDVRNAHAAICDGYGYNAGALYHHLNLGWGGSRDAWYNLPNVDTDWYQFTNVLHVLFNIYTNGVGEILSGRVTDTVGVPIPAAHVSAVWPGGTRSTVTDAKGIYAFAAVPSNTRFTVSANKAGFQFARRTTTTGFSGECLDPTYNPAGNRWGIDFPGTQNHALRVIAGVVARSDGTGVEGVTLQFSDGGGTATSDAAGFFFNLVPAGWTGTITPAKDQHLCEPVSRSITSITTNLGDQNFTAVWILHVDRKATGANDGSSWANAFGDVQSALAEAVPGTEIWVAEGVYRPGSNRSDTFRCKNGVKLLGGFGGGETNRSQRSWASHLATLSGDIGVAGYAGDNVYHVVKGTNGARLDGFTISGGYADSTNIWGDGTGAGVFNDSRWPTDFIAANCRIVGNWATNQGGGGFRGIFLNCVISNNTASQGGGASAALLTNCLLSGNLAISGGAGSYTTNINCTLVNNDAEFTGGLFGGSACNSIIYFNTSGLSAPNNYYLDPVLTYCCTFPNPGYVGNQTSDPHFADAAHGDYRLVPGSPCINAASNQLWMANATDLDGHSRILQSTPDIGAYETDLSQPWLVRDPAKVSVAVPCGRDSSGGSFVIWNAGGGTLNYSITTDPVWISVAPAGGVSDGQRQSIGVGFAAAGLEPGRYTGAIIINAPGANASPQTVEVALSVVPDFNPALDTVGLGWISEGDEAWVRQTNVTCDGVSAARSGGITDNQRSVLRTTVTGPGVLTFWWKVSSEQRYDYLRFLLGGVTQNEISGEVDWQQQTFSVAAGSQELSWVYSKDSSFSRGQDAAWLDRVCFVRLMQLVTPCRSGGSFECSIATVVGTTYGLEFKNNLSDAHWTALPLVPGDGTIKVLTDPGASSVPQRFYRVRQQ
jgi:hypothetical protein